MRLLLQLNSGYFDPASWQQNADVLAISGTAAEVGDPSFSNVVFYSLKTGKVTTASRQVP
ncbi:MAG: hypothetical protein AAGE59_21215 [Cyanobacteria bacterium P01_F01_bin.86]